MNTVGGLPGRLVVALLAVGAGFGAIDCSSENGKGFIVGQLDVPACRLDDMGRPVPLLKKDMLTGDNLQECRDRAIPGQDMPFCGEWNHFVAEPFDSTSPRHPENQLNIRMQSISGGWEFADAAFFWIYDSWEVGRCVRGRMDDQGNPDWNTEACDRTSGSGRMLIGTEGELVASHFVLQNFCTGASLSADALGSCAGGTCPEATICPGRSSWISFTRFGDLSAPPTQELSRDFKVNKDDPVEASAFHIELCDGTTVDAVKNKMLPIPVPAILGTLDGRFSFKMLPNFR